MKKSQISAKSLLQVGCVSLFLWACGGAGADLLAGDATEVTPRSLGDSLSGLSGSEQAAFASGLQAFVTTEDPDEGLGPVFNGTSCGQCHSAGAVGGAAPDIGVALETRVGGYVNGVYSDYAEFGGPVIQQRSIKEMIPSCPIERENIPPGAQFVSRRLTTPLFGAGLIEAVPDAYLVSLARQIKPFGIRGKVNMVANPISGRTEVGKFGWKAQVSKLDVFAADAYLNEMGVSSPVFPEDVKPNGQPIPDGWDLKADPEDNGDDVIAFAAYMRFLAPPSSALSGTPQSMRGARVFRDIGCAACHVPELRTGQSPSPALANKIVRLYSDLLLHKMGGELADGIVQSKAAGDEFRTAPLWGLSLRPFLLHDGRATTVEMAILAHGGEAQQVRENYLRQPPGAKSDLREFLRSL